MENIISILFCVSVLVLYNYFLRRRKGTLSKTDKTKYVVGSNNGENKAESTQNGKPRGSMFKRIAKFILLYFSVAFSSAFLSGTLGGLAQVYAEQAYTITRFAAPVFVYIVFLYFLAKKYSLAHSAKLMSYVYMILILLRVVYIIISDIQLAHSVLPYILLLLLSGAIFVAKRTKAECTENVKLIG